MSLLGKDREAAVHVQAFCLRTCSYARYRFAAKDCRAVLTEKRFSTPGHRSKALGGRFIFGKGFEGELMRYFVLCVGLVVTIVLGAFQVHAAPPACDAAREGTIIYNKDHKLVQFCNGTQWIGMVARIGGGDDTLGDLNCSSGQIAKWSGSAWACAADETGLAGLPSLTSARIWVGNDSNVAAAVNLSGDATLSNAGALTIANNAVTTAKINNAAVTEAKIDANAVTTAKIAASAVTNAEIANATIVATTKLSATGTKNATTFLRGDNTWAAPPSGGAVPAGTWCGIRALRCSNNTVQYHAIAERACGGSTITATCSSGTPTAVCPSGYVSTLVGQIDIVAGGFSTTTLTLMSCLKT
jgi:hypothetical protein